MILRVALIGLGAVGELHLRSYRDIAGIELVAAADLDEARLRQQLEGTGIQAFADHLQLLDNVRPDIACVVTPAASHEQIVLDCARAGAHVLCEKPMALSLESAHKMAAACTEAGVQFCYGASYRYLPALIVARQLIRAGEIGRVQLLREEILGGRGADEWTGLPPAHYPDGGPGGSGMGLMDHGIHLIDAFCWLTGADIRRVTGRGNLSGAPPCTEYILLDLTDGAAGLLTYNDSSYSTELPNEGVFAEGSGWDAMGFVPAGSWSSHAGSIDIYGTRGSLRIFHYANALFRFNADGIRRIPLSGRPSTTHFGTQLEAFADSLRSGSPPPVGADAGISALRAALAVYESDRSGQTITLP